MTNVDGHWNLVITSPMGDQQAVLIVKKLGDTLGDTFTGTCTLRIARGTERERYLTPRTDSC